MKIEDISSQQRTAMKHPSGQVRALSRALSWRRWAPKRALLLLRRGGALSWGEVAASCPPSLQRKGKPGPPHFSFHLLFLLGVIEKTRETSSRSQKPTSIFHRVWSKCGVLVSWLLSLHFFLVLFFQFVLTSSWVWTYISECGLRLVWMWFKTELDIYLPETKASTK